MYCTIAPSQASGLLNSHHASVGHQLIHITPQLEVARACSTGSSGSGSESLPSAASFHHQVAPKYTVIGREELARQMASERTRKQQQQTTISSAFERKTRAARNHLNHHQNATSSSSCNSLSSGSGGNVSPTSFYLHPGNQEDLLHQHQQTQLESYVAMLAHKQAAQQTQQQFRPSTRYHQQQSHNPNHHQQEQARSQYLSWRNNNIHRAQPSKDASETKASAPEQRGCSPAFSMQSYVRDLAKGVTKSPARKPQVPPRCEKVVELLRGKGRKSAKPTVEVNIRISKTPDNTVNAAATSPQPNKNDLLAANHEQDTASQSARQSFLETYNVQGVIGVGGGGMVYAGTRTADQHPVAIKRVMREKVKRWEKIQGRTIPQEIALMIRVNGHRGIIRLLDWYECLDSFILILERPTNSVDLFDYIREVGRMNEKEASMIFRQILTAVHHIHSRGVVHRDIKDENIVLNRDTGESKLIDFGCGTMIHERPYRDFSGTPEFYPPEWFNEHYYNARPAAIWSLGVLLFDMLCGEIPFKSKAKIGLGKFEFKGNLSNEAKHLITWLLSIKPESRPTLVDIMQHPWISGKTF